MPLQRKGANTNFGRYPVHRDCRRIYLYSGDTVVSMLRSLTAKFRVILRIKTTYLYVSLFLSNGRIFTTDIF